MSFSEKIDINCDYNQVNNETEDENNEEIENHQNFKKDSRVSGGETFKKLKKIISHVGLLIALMLYTASGGLVFRAIELPAELDRLTRLRDHLIIQRFQFINSVVNSTDVINFATLVDYKLKDYESAVQTAVQDGLFINLVYEINDPENRDDKKPPMKTDRWSVLQAVFFASTVLTTIGYGNIVPATDWGRIFCILFALVGIPLTLTVIADWGKLFAEGVSEIALKIRSNLPERLNSCMPNNLAGRRSLGAFAAVVLLFLYLACGAGMFMLWEEDWGFFEGFYFCFVTMTTIGFGDLVPKKPKYMLLCTLYILVGLALTGTIIELVRRQYAQSWRRLQALSGPLTETLKKIGEHAGGDMSAFQSDLRRALTIISMPRLKRCGTDAENSKEHEWEKAVEDILWDIANASPSSQKNPIMQIVIYESSV